MRNFGSHIGRAEVADEVVGPNFTELWISVDPNVKLEPTVAKIEEVVYGYPGLQRDVLTYLEGKDQGSLNRRGGDGRRPRLWFGSGDAAFKGLRNRRRR